MRFRDRDELISRTASALFVDSIGVVIRGGAIARPDVRSTAEGLAAGCWEVAKVLADAKPEETPAEIEPDIRSSSFISELCGHERRLKDPEFSAWLDGMTGLVDTDDPLAACDDETVERLADLAKRYTERAKLKETPKGDKECP